MLSLVYRATHEHAKFPYSVESQQAQHVHLRSDIKLLRSHPESSSDRRINIAVYVKFCKYIIVIIVRNTH